MTETPALRASDADRERAVVLLREHMVEGRLTLEEFADRMSTAYLARTTEELEHLSRDLPPVPARSQACSRAALVRAPAALGLGRWPAAVTVLFCGG